MIELILKIEEIIQRVIIKITSGKWILTVACAFAFLYCVLENQLPITAIVAIIVCVFKDYFGKTNK